MNEKIVEFDKRLQQLELILETLRHDLIIFKAGLKDEDKRTQRSDKDISRRDGFTGLPTDTGRPYPYSSEF